MIPSTTRLEILRTSFVALRSSVWNFMHIYEASPAKWEDKLDTWRSLVSAMQTQLEDYREAIETDTEADRQSAKAAELSQILD